MTPNPWNNVPKTADFADLDGYSDQYQPEYKIATGLEVLPDGTYDFEVLKATFDQIQSNRIVRVKLKRLPVGEEMEWIIRLYSQDGVNTFCADLASLGFDAERWGPRFGRPLSREIPTAVSRLPGLKFRGAKKTDSPSEGKYQGQHFHKLRVLCKITGQPMPPLTSPQAAAPPPAMPPSQPLPAVPAGMSDEDVPF